MNMINNSFLMQSEVSGDIRLGRLDSNQIRLLINSIKRNELESTAKKSRKKIKSGRWEMVKRSQ